MTPFRKNQNIYLDDAEFEVLSEEGRHTRLENRLTGQRIERTTYELLEKFVLGKLRVMPNNIARPPMSTRFLEPLKNVNVAEDKRFSKLSDASQAESQRRIEYCIELDRSESFSGTREKLVSDIARIATRRGEHRPPHFTTIYRWKKKFEATGRAIQSLFARFDERGGKGKSRLHPKVEELLDQAIDETVLVQKRCAAELVQERLDVLIAAENLRRADGDQLQTMSLRTIQRRVQEIPSYDLDVARYGKVEADRRHAHKGNSRLTKRILELVEIDHTPLDLMVVDDDGVVVGRPVLTTILDRHSRCILGYHLSLAGYGTPSVYAALRHALLPKTYLKSLYPEDDLEWPCFGWFERLLTDNGQEFHADSVKKALLSLYIVVEYAASKSPNDKPFIERFFRTLNWGLIHTLPGTTLSKAHLRVGFDPEKEALLTLAQVDRILHVWICKRYHNRPHRGLDRQTPMQVWEMGAQAHPPQLKLNARDVEIELSEHEVLIAQHYGINLNGFVYTSRQLTAMRSNSPKGLKVDVRWSKLNVGHIWVWDPAINDYFQVKNKRAEFDGLTLEQAKAVIEHRAKNRSKYAKSGSTAMETIRNIVEVGRDSKKLRDRKQSARQENQRSAHSTVSEIEDVPRCPDRDDVDSHHPTTASSFSFAQEHVCTGHELDVVVELPKELQEY